MKSILSAIAMMILVSCEGSGSTEWYNLFPADRGDEGCEDVSGLSDGTWQLLDTKELKLNLYSSILVLSHINYFYSDDIVITINKSIVGKRALIDTIGASKEEGYGLSKLKDEFLEMYVINSQLLMF